MVVYHIKVSNLMKCKYECIESVVCVYQVWEVKSIGLVWFDA